MIVIHATPGRELTDISCAPCTIARYVDKPVDRRGTDFLRPDAELLAAANDLEGR
jgi:hypothetical protein